MNQPPTVRRSASPSRPPAVPPFPHQGSFAAPSWPARLALIALIGALLLVGMLQLRTPAPLSAKAAETEFSAERAMVHLRAIATDPRPTDSEAAANVRQYLMDELSALGLQPEVQAAAANTLFPASDYFTAGTVHNVVARLPGSASSGAIVLDAHYDGGSTGPAASDNGSGVVTVLETLRAVLAGEPLKNDLIVVFTDAEEDQDLGAVAFTEEHPWMADARVAINFEAQGADGPVLPYVTGPQDSDWLVSELLAVAPHPSAYSLVVALSELLWMQRPGCDLHEFVDSGVPGIGFVYVGNTNVYHTRLDSVDTISPGTIQQEGGYTLALVRRLGGQDLTQALPAPYERIYFNVLPGVVAAYPAGWAVPLAAIVSAALVALLVVGIRRRRLTPGGVIGATTAYLGGTLLMVIVVTLLWAGVRLANANYQVTLAGTYQTMLLTVALGLASVATVAALWALLRRRVQAANLAAGGLLVWALLLWTTSLGVPVLSYLFAWPLLFALLPLAWLVLAGERAGRTWAPVAVLAAGLVPAAVFLPANLYQVLGWLNRFALADLPTMGLVSLFIAPVAVLLAPQLEFVAGEAGRGVRRWRLVGAVAAPAVILLIVAMATSGYSAARPRPDKIAYELNADSGQALWVSRDAHLDNWTSRFIAAGSPRGEFESLPGKKAAAYTAAAPNVGVAAPQVQVVSDTTAADGRTMGLRLTSGRGAGRLEVLVQAEGGIVAATIDGKPLDLTEYAPATDGRLEFTYVGLEPDGVELSITVAHGTAVSLTVRDITYGLPDVDGLTPAERPADTMPALLAPRDATIVTKTVTF
ncbi:MAG: M28 family peptidase [Anaerolineae bacterium]